MHISFLHSPVNGKENPGLSESQTPYARSGPKSDHNGQPTNNNPDTGDGTATYAAVDMSKKKKKKQEGEVLYADLDSMRPGNIIISKYVKITDFAQAFL
ncbi:hypothetical protein AC249_AIPGENE28506 [Exaiptasia diaphana]|nr:hypothetical protein AC249_AIPGENE28506 [Exaiptasia diaphana]